jgi:hypothetical protein
MAEIVNSLFGIDPAALQQQRAIMDANQAYRFAQLNPMERANMALYQGGAGLGRAATQLLGGDEQLSRATQIRQLASQVDFSDPDSIDQFAQRVSAINPQVAAEAAQRAANLRLTGARTAKALQERVTPTSGLGKLLTEKQELLSQGVPANDPRIQAYDRAIAAEGEGKGVKVINMPPDTRGKAFEAADPEALKEYRTQARAAAGQVSLINQARENLPGAVVGQGLPSVIRGLNAQLAPLGINTEQVAKTRNLEQALKSIIAQGIKQYGANPSTVDLQFAVQAATNIQDPVAAIRATLDYLETRARTNVNKADAAEQYLLKNNNLAGFEKQWAEQTLSTKPKGTKTRTLKSGIVVTEED